MPKAFLRLPWGGRAEQQALEKLRQGLASDEFAF
jgi:hypothetical protein